jgi:hypothetical protein
MNSQNHSTSWVASVETKGVAKKFGGKEEFLEKCGKAGKSGGYLCYEHMTYVGMPQERRSLGEGVSGGD